MLERIARGTLPAKPHTALRGPNGDLRWEECLTRAGFDGPYSILYHEHRPHESRALPAARGFTLPSATERDSILRRHFRASGLAATGAPPVGSRVPLLFNEDVVLGVSRPGSDDPVYFSNGDADEIFFIHEGGGTLRSQFGDLAFGARDYVVIPRGVIHRFLLTADVHQLWFSIECRGGMSLPKQYRNEIGQLVMGAPYSHRDFRAPEFRGPLDEGIREQVVLRNGAFHGYELRHSPLDLVGFDGTVYPFVFPIEKFTPRVGQVHLPPTVHGTFAARGALICSFVPRPLDFHPESIPCPYPHSSVDVDEVIFYSAGNFTSRRGVGPSSISFHPAGVPHGPHPGAYEGSIGARSTDEIAVMLDCARPLSRTPQAVAIEDAAYHESFTA